MALQVSLGSFKENANTRECFKGVVYERKTAPNEHPQRAYIKRNGPSYTSED